MRFIVTFFNFFCILLLSNVAFGNVKINNYYSKGDIKRLIIANAKPHPPIKPEIPIFL